MSRTLVALALIFFPGMSHAHKPSDSYLALEIDAGGVRGQWDIALRDLEYAIGLDADGDGEITWGELRARQAQVAAYALAHIEFAAGGKACKARVQRQLVDHHSDGAYTVLFLVARCPDAVRTLRIRYRLFFDLDPQHRGLMRLTRGGSQRSFVFSPEHPEQEIGDLPASAGWQELSSYGREGIWHILIGYDHILFLLSLLLPAVLRRSGGEWVVQERFADAFFDVLKVVTAFTLAHSVTLSLAALGIVRLPARWVESAIAASIVVAALNNLYPIADRGRWVVAFSFGLVHGFGFANVLADLGLPSTARVLALLGFNLGVELGQLAIVCAFLPIAYCIRATRLYRRLALGLGSVAIAGLGGLWFVERSLNFDVPIV